MGIVAKQASRNASVILIGTIFGAVNNVFILPRAFQDNKAGLGFIAFMVAVAMISSQIFSFSAQNIFVYYIPKLKDRIKENALVSCLLLISALGLVIYGIGSILTLDLVKTWLSASDALLYEQYLWPVMIMTGSVVFFYAFSGFLNAKFETVLVNLLLDPFTKISYLVLAVAFLFQLIDYTTFIWLFVLSYFSIAVIAAVRTVQLGFKFQPTLSIHNAKEVASYGFYSVLDKGAAIITQKLDVIMIALILDFDFAGEFIIAFFVGSVVIIPFRSIYSIASPIVSKEIGANNTAELKQVYQKTALFAFILGAFIFSVVWINIDAILAILPEKFRGGKWVVFFIGLAKLFSILASVSSSFIVYSKYYKFILKLNVMLLFFTVATNLWLITKYGTAGAAAATALTTLVFTCVKVGYVRQKFKLMPYTTDLIKVIVLFLALITATSYITLELNPFVEIIIKGSAFALLYLAGLKMLRVIPELKSLSSLKELIKGN
ncbi:MAG: lipopolysaccharide biosynthesis protein [Flavobacteriales bacterium]